MESPVVHALVLGALQGLTEFLPVSSSGHLALAQIMIPGFRQPGLLLDVMLHAGTLAAVLIYFRRDLLDIAAVLVKMATRAADQDPEAKKLVIGVVIASVPTALIGLLLEERVEGMFSSMAAVGAALVVTGAVLVVGELAGRAAAGRPGFPGKLASLLVGIAQGIAVVPGISRSGATISTARALGIDGPAAARFSFVASIPAVAGATFLTAVKNADAIAAFGSAEVLAYLVGPLAAAAVGYGAIEVVMRFVKTGRFMWFSIYCFALGGAALGAGWPF